MPIALPTTIEVTDSTNSMDLTINGTTKKVIIESKKYNSQSEFVTALQKAIDNTFGNGYGGALVSLNNGKLVFTARTDDKHFGENTSIACGTNTSTLLTELNSTRKPATLTIIL